MKIDQSFVQGLGTDHEDERIVAAVVDLAANLGLRSIAEGVETHGPARPPARRSAATRPRATCSPGRCRRARSPAAIAPSPGVMTLLHLNLQRLEDTAELGRALISRLPGAGLLIVDADLRILLADGDVHRDLPADIVGKRVDDVIPAEAWVRARAALPGRARG